MKTMASSEFKAKCLGLLDDVARTGEPITILKRGRPVAQLVPAVPRGEGYPQHAMVGSVRILGNIVEPALPPEAWDAESGKL
jgi:prevent-host-death family protein